VTIPNWITLSRLLGLPVILYGLHQSSSTWHWTCLAIFLLAASTDWLDGYLARKLNQVSELGKFLDPLVDKLLILIPLLALIENQTVPAWGVCLILFRELAIAGWRVNQTSVTGANIWGKLKTVTQIAAVALLIAPLTGGWTIAALSFFWASVAITLVSGVIYVYPAKSEI
jgi:CDP-diacylglycerol---glycerol-3-phosphate 3-phosphatidyltransferase